FVSSRSFELFAIYSTRSAIFTSTLFVSITLSFYSLLHCNGGYSFLISNLTEIALRKLHRFLEKIPQPAFHFQASPI
ncbi:MAG: hypothetical protein KAT65_16285, partial [Methanophagales archaeon]|nr:hypothetical protein [Methanophagales archaeon]